jgi:aryl-phospho-beta-D-glucosidase BglC (GH1 family)
MASSPNAREILEKHWDTFITESDFEYIASKGINTVRIPVCTVTCMSALLDLLTDEPMTSDWLLSSLRGRPLRSRGH